MPKTLVKSFSVLLMCSALTGCVDDKQPVGKPKLGKPPAWAMVDCGQLEQLATNKMARREFMRVLGEDASKFVTCRERHRALVRYILHRDSLLSGRPIPSLKD